MHIAESAAILFDTGTLLYIAEIRHSAAKRDLLYLQGDSFRYSAVLQKLNYCYIDNSTKAL